MSRTSRIGIFFSRHRRVVVAVGAVIVVVALAFPIGLTVLHGGLPGASTGTSTDMSTGASTGSAIGAAEPAKSPAAANSGAPGGSGSGTAAAGSATPDRAGAMPPAAATPLTTGPKLARSAWLGVKVKDVVEGSAKVRAIALSAGGQVLSENVVTGPDPTGGYDARLGMSKGPEIGSLPPVGVNEARLTLSVPAEKLDAVLSELSSAALGTVSYRSSQSDDITDTYIDTQARIQPAKDSIDRIRTLLAKASSLGQVVQLESELTRRQADLDSLQQRFAELERRTTTSEVSVTLWTDATVPVTTTDEGFLGALKTAGRALLGSLMVIVTGLAVLLPWLLLALVIAWFVRLWLRHRRPPTPTT